MTLSRTPPPRYRWHIFFTEFWGAFGRMMAVFSVFFVVVGLFVDTSAASFESAQGGLVFALVISAIYGASEGDVLARE